MRLQHNQDDWARPANLHITTPELDWQQLCQQASYSCGALNTRFVFFAGVSTTPQIIPEAKLTRPDSWTLADYQQIWRQASFYQALAAPNSTLKNYMAIPIARAKVQGLLVLHFAASAPKLSQTQYLLLNTLATYAALLYQEQTAPQLLKVDTAAANKHRKEQSSRRLFKRLKKLFNDVPIPINAFDEHQRCIFWNQACEQVLGWSKTEIKQHPAPLQLFYPDEQEQQQLKAAFNGECNSEFKEWQLRHRNGQLLTMLWAHIKLPNGDTLCVGHDMSVQHEIAHLQRLATNVFESSYDGIMVTDADHCITHINPAFTRITGYQLDEVKGRYPDLLKYLPADRKLYLELVAHFKSHDFWQGELTGLRKNGESYSLLLAVTAVKSDAGQVLSHVSIFTDITYLKQHEAQLRHQAFHDALTGVPNRLLFGELLERAIASAERDKGRLAVCYLDLDGFKAVNDKLGHAAGDQLLIEVSRRLGSITRSCDAMSRLGGDEFALLFTGLHSIEEGEEILKRVHNIINQTTYIEGEQVKVSASIGVALYPEDADEAELLLRYADQAMYEAKKQGKNGYVFFDESQTYEQHSHAQQLALISQGLARGELCLYYLPAIDLHTQRVVRLEALLRWQHPQQGLRTPSDFLPIVMGSALELELGVWVIEEVLKQIEIWQQQGLTLKVSFNVSAGQLLDDNFTPKLAHLLSAYPASFASQLELEFQESAIQADINAAVDALQRCRDLGISMSIDNFGTGYSSLSHLNQLPIDTIKIDRSFINDLLSNAHDLSMVTSVIQLAAALKLNVMAEGVEEAAQGVRLLQLGCTQVQGFGISQPMPAAHVPAWLKSWNYKLQ
ncbi:sensor domain-containing protein [Oceanisphaera avium]|uniref:GGDEF domain-containing protein n=1 Tax=Oceanisphaera avium TaxID=1903694 RepID=A0A1Y0D0J5_9GAMM|nr:EAL domain-containing protein [Oceanisphaera avium]ART80626.1 hypothetical protein CBP12_11120 [Oceanisphaera avium]